MKGRSHRADHPEDWVDGSWTVDCICGVTYDDGEEMVNCDECGVWVHTRCSRYVKGDDLFACDKCKSKNSRNDIEETEVAQLLVELPTKTMRMETSFVSNGPPRRPFRLWTDLPMEDRVHVHGIPGGDPALFGGLSSIITAPGLWKCSGYVPKKFNLSYKEFPGWDDKDGVGTNIEDENENQVDKGAGVLFSLSKETVLANPMAASVDMRSKNEEGCHSRKKYSKEAKCKGDDLDDKPAKVVQNERRLLQPIVLHSCKQKKEDSGTSRDRIRKKRDRVANKDSDMKKKVLNAPKEVVFTPTSDAGQLDFHEDRSPRLIETERIKNRNVRDVSSQSLASNGYLAVQNNSGKPKNSISIECPSNDLSSDVSRNNSSAVADHEEIKAVHHANVRIESSSLRNDGAAMLEPNDAVTVPRTELVNGMVADNLDYGKHGSCRSVMEPVVDVATAPHDIKASKLENVTDVVSLCLVQENVSVKTESAYYNSGSVLKLESCSHDATHQGITFDHISGDSEVMGATVGSTQSISQKVQDVDINCAASGCQTNIVDVVTGGPFHHKREEEVSKVAEPNFLGSKSSDVVPRKSSMPENCKTMENQDPNHSNMQQATPGSSLTISKDCIVDSLKEEDRQDIGRKTKRHPKSSDGHASSKRDRATGVFKDEDRYNPDRKSMKEQPQFSASSAFKTSHTTRISHCSAPKRPTSESKDSVISTSSRMSAHNIAVTSGESSGLQNQTHSQSSSKVNPVPSTYPPPPSNALAALSDEELALLLHQELNSSPRVPRVPRVRNAGSVPQLASPTGTSNHVKRASSSGGKDHNLVSRRKGKDVPKEGFHFYNELKDEAKKMDRVHSSSPDQRRDECGYRADAIAKREDVRSAPAIPSFEKNPAPVSIKIINNGLSLLAEANEHDLSPRHGSPRNMSEDDVGTVGDRVHRTLPGLINEIMSKGQRMTYEELCNAVLPHWQNLRKHNGERYAYSSHSQAVLDCLRNRHEWAQLVDRGPKTNSGRKRRKYDAEPSFESEGHDFVNGKSTTEVEGKSFGSREEFPKGKRKARKRRRLALQGRELKDIRKTRKADLLTDEDVGASSNSSEDSMFSEDEIQGGGTHPTGSGCSGSSVYKVNK